jgi:hypothetical protein
VAKSVSDGLKARIAGEEKEQIESIPTVSLEAYNTYMLGSYYMIISIYSPDRKSSNQSEQKARIFFERAIDMDSTFSDAYAALDPYTSIAFIISHAILTKPGTFWKLAFLFLTGPYFMMKETWKHLEALYTTIELDCTMRPMIYGNDYPNTQDRPMSTTNMRHRDSPKCASIFQR